MQARKIKILLIEDDPFIAGLYATKFSNEGFSVAQASDGESGLNLALNEKPNLILLDLKLPGVDGFSVLERLKADRATKKIPVVILTNLGESDEVRRGLRLGAADYLIKANFLPSEVVEKAKRAIKH